jgi:Leu/Phe-tRNA-protein transferase
MSNQFDHLDAQNETHRLAQVGAFEQDPEEFDAWTAQVEQSNFDRDVEQDAAHTLFWGTPALNV